MIEIIDAISSHLNAGLAAAGYPKLTPLLDGQPGKIVIGNRHQYDQLAPPRIIFLPTRGTFDTRTSGRGVVSVALNQRPDAESKAAMGQRALFTEMMSFEAAVFSLARDGHPDSGALDFTYTQKLYHQLIASCQALMAGNFTVEGGVWRGTAHAAPRVGREFVFGITFMTPVLMELAPTELAPKDESGLPAVAGLRYAPAGVTASITDMMVGPSGITGPGCE